MHTLLDALTQYPTLIFTALLALCLVYWLFVLVGTLDIDALDGSLDAAAHAVSLEAFGPRGVPTSIFGSLFTLAAWAVSVAGALLGLSGWLWGTLLLLAALAVAFPLARLATRPLAPVFRTAEGVSHADLIGKLCVVTTGSVSPSFGQARCDDPSGDHLIQVRHDTPDAFKRHDRALIIDYDPSREAFLIEPLDPNLREL